MECHDDELIVSVGVLGWEALLGCMICPFYRIALYMESIGHFSFI